MQMHCVLETICILELTLPFVKKRKCDVSLYFFCLFVLENDFTPCFLFVWQDSDFILVSPEIFTNVCYEAQQYICPGQVVGAEGRGGERGESFDKSSTLLKV
jgi:hypothetical protein